MFFGAKNSLLTYYRKRNYQKANEPLDFKFDFSSEKIKYYPTSRFSTEYAMPVCSSFNTCNFDYFNHNELANINSNYKNSRNLLENNIDIMKNLPIKIFDNYNYNVFKDNETTYSRKIYKIHELMRKVNSIAINLWWYLCYLSWSK